MTFGSWLPTGAYFQHWHLINEQVNFTSRAKKHVPVRFIASPFFFFASVPTVNNGLDFSNALPLHLRELIVHFCGVLLGNVGNTF